MKKVAITGGTGVIGEKLSALLIKKGYEVIWISRSKNSKNPYPTYTWNELENCLNDVDYVIHLAGAGIADKAWTKEQKKIILSSRTETAQQIFDYFKPRNNQLKAFISSSAIGYYGIITSDKIYEEDDTPGNDFLAETCVKWESVVDQFETVKIRTVKIRTGIVLSTDGGALVEIAKPIKYNFGAAIGSGKQYIAWIHVEDLCNMYVHAIENENMHGAFNAVTPEHMTNKDFTKAVAHQLKKILWLPNVPAFVLKLMLGKRAQLVLEGSRVSSSKIIKTGFQFKFPKLREALQELYPK